MAKLTQYRCGKCGRRLPENEWVFSRFTRTRYCLPGKCRSDRAPHHPAASKSNRQKGEA